MYRIILGLHLFFVISFASAVAKARQTNVMNSPKVFVAGPSVPRAGLDLLVEKGVQLTKVENESKEDILKKVKGVDALFWASHLKLDKDVLDSAGSQMKVIGTMSAGYNHIDLEELRKRGIKLGNTPNVLNDAVADVAVLLSLAASRRLHEGRLKIENDQWKSHSEWMLGKDIVNSTVGIVGLGGIGQTIVRRLKGFDVKEFLYTGHREKPEGKELGAKFVSLDTLTRESDFVIMAVPLTNETEGMCNEDFFSKMKKTAVFVNISRGQVVDQPALIQALRNETIFAAGLDVMTPEPLPSNHELLTLPNLVLLPHLGSATRQTRDAMSLLTAQNILRGLGGEEMFTPVV
ncbi:glyoxylate reductase/hydroxypyruvate reductase isoform X2 [Leptinotarsa decemlineata]|uniref:glyoxylate reductase/hydroxypyruvate reductase isoform X2 n=1 Tax=Leptinotarsa decemlineata TaxID=7539 RepID=UPI003D309DE6